MTTDAGDDKVLLFEWHVGLYVRRDLGDRDAEEVRARVGRQLLLWAAAVQAVNPGTFLTVES